MATEYEQYNSASTSKSKPWLWVFVGLGGGCLTVVLLCAGLAGLGVFGLFQAIKSSEPYTVSLERSQSSAEAQQLLGTPIEAGTLVQGNINLNNNDGSADLNYSISGPKGSATVNVEGTKKNGRWSFQVMEIVPEGSQATIDLLE